MFGGLSTIIQDLLRILMFSVVIYNARTYQLYWTPKTIIHCCSRAFLFFKHWPSGLCLLIPSSWSQNYKNEKKTCDFCSRYWYQISKIHSCFLIDVCLISKLLKILLDGASSFVGPRLFKRFQNFGNP